MVFHFPSLNIIRPFYPGHPDTSGGPREPRHQCPTCTEKGNNSKLDKPHKQYRRIKSDEIMVADMASRIFLLETTATRCGVFFCKSMFDC